MEKIDYVLVIDNSSNRTAEVLKCLREGKVGDNIKVAVNADHALLCLEHLSLMNSVKGKRIMILLNMETPMMNGAEFLENARYKDLEVKDRILTVVMKDLCSPQNVELARRKGVTAFISTPVNISELKEIISAHFTPERKAKKNGKPVNQSVSIN